MKKLLLLFLLAVPCFAQTFAGRAGSDIFIPGPYRLCIGDEINNSCFVYDGAATAKVNGSLNFMWAPITVAKLPAAASNIGRTYRVTDASSGSTCTSGGGSNSVICTSNGSAWVTLGSGGSSNYQTVQSGGSGLPQEPIINFAGTTTCVDNPGSTRTDCTSTAGSGFPVTAAQQVQTGGSIAPSALGQNVANQERWTVGPPQPSVSMTLTGGSISSSHAAAVQITLNSAAGETLPGQALSGGYNTASFGSTCTSGNACTLTVNAPTLACGALPCGGYVGYTVYMCDQSSTPVTCAPTKQTLNGNCVNITGNCTITGANLGGGGALPSTNTAFAWPTPLGTNLCSPGTFVTGFLQDINGTYYPYMGVDSSNTGTNPPAPYNKLLFCRPVWFTDTGTDPPPGKNGLIVISHTQNGVAVNQNNQDRGLSVFTSNCIPSSQTCSDNTGHYALEGIQVEQDFDGTATITGSPDAEVAAGSFQTFIQTNGTNYSSNSFGSHAVRANISRYVGSGIDTTSMSGVWAAFSNQSSLSGGSVIAAGVQSLCGSTVTAPALGCAAFLVTSQSTTGSFANGQFGFRVLADNAGFAPSDPRNNGSNKYNGVYDAFIDNRQHGNWVTNLNGSVFTSEINNSAAGTIPITDAIQVKGAISVIQTPSYTLGSVVSCSGGASTYSYQLVPLDANGAAVNPGATITSTANCTNPLSVGNPLTLALGVGPYGRGISSIAIYRTAGPMATGKIATVTCTITNVLVNGNSLACQNGSNFVDNGLTADGGTPPTVNTTGGIFTPGYSALSGNKFFVASNFTTANNTNFQTITGLVFNLSPAAGNYQFSCHGAYSQGTANASVAFGIQSATVAPSNIFATGKQQTAAATAPAPQTLATLNTTTATGITSGTPGATGTNYTFDLDGTIENPANDAGNVINIVVSTATGTDPVTVLRGSYCYLY